MDHPIGLTPAEIWNGLLGLAQAVAVIWAAYLVIKQVVANAQAPDHKQNERLDLIEERLAKIEAHITTDRTDISDLKEGRRIEMQALQAILGHDISGNNEEELRSARTGLESYINSHLV